MVEGDSGMMGGSVSHEYMAFAEAGEDEIVFCRECGYAANVEMALAGADREPPVSESGAGGRTRRGRDGRSLVDESGPRPAPGPSIRSSSSSACRRAPS